MTLVGITGGSGFVGRATVAAIASLEGCTVRLLSRTPDAGPPADEIVVGDITDHETCDRLVEGADVVVHVAGLVRSRDEAVLRRVNVEGSTSLVRAARRAGVRRFVHVSSTGVYGRPGVGVDENSPHRPETPYERSKAEAEEVVTSAWASSDLVVVQPSNVIGLGHPLHPLRRFLVRAAAGGRVIHAGAWTNYVGVRDVARVIVAAATLEDVPSAMIVNVPLPLGDLVELAGEAVGRRGRSVQLPGVVGLLVGPAARAGSARFPELDRVRSLVDQTRFNSAQSAWLEAHGLRPQLGPVLREMAVGYGLVALP